MEMLGVLLEVIPYCLMAGLPQFSIFGGLQSQSHYFCQEPLHGQVGSSSPVIKGLQTKLLSRVAEPEPPFCPELELLHGQVCSGFGSGS